jgi:hypothetical protein
MERHAVVATCPKCEHRSEFIRATPPHIDSCGFESHSCRCIQCASFLVGVIDPLDGVLLVSLFNGPTEGGSLPDTGRELSKPWSTRSCRMAASSCTAEATPPSWGETVR